MKTAVYAGTFDPITNGHLNVLARAAKVFDQVIIAVAADHNKQTLFTLEERTALVKESVAHLENVQAKVFSGLLVNFAREQGATALVRGLRMVSDFEYEMQMALFNKDLCQEWRQYFLLLMRNIRLSVPVRCGTLPAWAEWWKNMCRLR